MSEELVVTKAELGKAISLESVKREQKLRRDAIVLKVGIMHKEVEAYEESLRNCIGILAYHKERIRAVENGEFEIDKHGVQFHNSFLQSDNLSL